MKISSLDYYQPTAVHSQNLSVQEAKFGGKNPKREFDKVRQKPGVAKIGELHDWRRTETLGESKSDSEKWRHSSFIEKDDDFYHILHWDNHEDDGSILYWEVRSKVPVLHILLRTGIRELLPGTVPGTPGTLLLAGCK